MLQCNIRYLEVWMGKEPEKEPRYENNTGKGTQRKWEDNTKMDLNV
jgi:hypothetical protein